MREEPLPEWLTFLSPRLISAGVLPLPFNHVLINEYNPGEGIMVRRCRLRTLPSPGFFFPSIVSLHILLSSPSSFSLTISLATHRWTSLLSPSCHSQPTVWSDVGYLRGTDGRETSARGQVETLLALSTAEKSAGLQR